MFCRTKYEKNYSYLIPTSLDINFLLLMEIKIIHIPMLQNQMGKIHQAFHRNRIMRLLFWLTSTYGPYDEANLTERKNLNHGTVITKAVRYGTRIKCACPKYENMFIFLKVRLIFHTFIILSKAVFSNLSDS
jgi:hypothetical protein